MDECRNKPCGDGAECTNIVGGFRCSCASGYRRNSALPQTLFQQNANTQTDSFDLQKLQSALNITSSSASLDACVDIDECADAQAQVCGPNSECVNTNGGYHCQCPPNFKKAEPPNSGCVDIDECVAQQHACGANSSCENLLGSHKCECKKGFAGKLPSVRVLYTCQGLSYDRNSTRPGVILSRALETHAALYHLCERLVYLCPAVDAVAT